MASDTVTLRIAVPWSSPLTAYSTYTFLAS